MRKDQFMAKHWIMEAEKIDNSNDNVIQCKELLFPANKSREEDLFQNIIKADEEIRTRPSPWQGDALPLSYIRRVERCNRLTLYNAPGGPRSIALG